MKKLLLSALLLLPLATAVPAGAAPAPVPEAVPAPVFLVQEGGGTCLAEASAPALAGLPREGQTKPLFKATLAECIAFCGANPNTVRLCRLTGGRCGLNPDTNECGCWYP